MAMIPRQGFAIMAVLAFALIASPLCAQPPLPGNGSLPAAADQVAPAPPATESAPAAPLANDTGSPDLEESANRQVSSSTPNMLGDMGGGQTINISSKFGSTLPFSYNVNTPGSGILGRQRIADNDSILPADRIFCDYSYFHDATILPPNDASRFVPGFEKTFLDGRASVEMRFPMGILASNNVVNIGPSDGSAGQFGDIQIILKSIVLQRDGWTLGAGLDISVPTAPDLNIADAFGAPAVKVANHSTHLLPFFGLLVQPNDDWFAQAFVQVDVPASGYAVSANVLGNGLTPCGDIYDQTTIFADASIGHWLYRNPAARFSGLAAVVEAHYTGGINAPSSLNTPVFAFSYNSAQYNVLDLTVGAHAVVGNTTVTLGFATPVTDDRGFDGELRFFVNRKF